MRDLGNFSFGALDEEEGCFGPLVKAGRAYGVDDHMLHQAALEIALMCVKEAGVNELPALPAIACKRHWSELAEWTEKLAALVETYSEGRLELVYANGAEIVLLVDKDWEPGPEAEEFRCV